MTKSSALVLRAVDRPAICFLLLRPEAILGRLPDCHYVVDDGSISRRHARLCPDDLVLEVTDLGSRNGTFIDNAPVQTGRLEPGQSIRFGSLVFGLSTMLVSLDGTTGSPGQLMPLNSRGPASEAVKPISQAQSRVLHLILEGQSEKEIARQLNLSPHTVHSHTQALFRIYNVNSRNQLMAAITRPGLQT